MVDIIEINNGQQKNESQVKSISTENETTNNNTTTEDSSRVTIPATGPSALGLPTLDKSITSYQKSDTLGHLPALAEINKD